MKNVALLLVGLLALISVKGCGGEGASGREDSGHLIIPAVEAVQAQFGSLPLEERLSGIVSVRNQIELYPRITAPVEEVAVQTGQQVVAGEVLVRLRDNEYRERLRQAEANLRISEAQERQALAALREVQAQVNRQRVLAERNLTSEAEMEQLEAQLESAEANHELSQARTEQAQSSVEEQREALEQTVIRAPIRGTIGRRTVEPGMQITPNTRLFTIGDLSDAKITVNLTERMLRYIETGQPVHIISENLGDTLITAEISRISPFLGAGSFSTQAEIDVNNAGRLLMPGMFVAVDVLYGESEQATIVPLSAIYRHPRTGQTGIYVATGFGLESEMLEELEIEENPGLLSNPTDVEFVPVEVIARGREAAGVTGVTSGQWVVTVGQNLLDNNQTGTARVRILSWDQIMDLQQLRPQDLLREIMNGDVVEGYIPQTQP